MQNLVATTDQQILFGSFQLDRDNALLMCDGEPVAITPKAMDVLHYLASRPDALVTKDELLSAIWPDVLVGDASIKVCVREIRKSLRDDAERPQYIQTVHRRGYRFIAPVSNAEAKTAGEAKTAVGKSEVVAQPEGARSSPQPAGRHAVGRRQELSTLRSAFDSASTGSGQVICVTGEPGIGKTTFVESFLAGLTADARDFYVARGRCSERLAGAEAYLPVLEALDSLARGEAGELAASALRSMAPAWYAEVAPPAASVNSPNPSAQASSQQRLKRELIALFEEVSRKRPLVLFLDDVHWADESTVDLLAYIADRCARMRLLLVLSYRPTEIKLSNHPLGPLQLELQSRGLSREIPLAFLNHTDVEDYLALTFAGHRFDAEFVDLICKSTEGNPLFLADLLRYLCDCGVIAQVSGAWILGKPVPDFHSELPASVRSLIQKKLAQLDVADNQLLSVASVQGYEFDSAILADVLGMIAIELEERLEVLDRVHGLVRRVREQEFPSGTITVRYQFVHILYQNALYAMLQPARRAAWSAAVAQALLANHGDQCSAIAGSLAALFEAARDYPAALEYLMLAARNAVRICAPREAIVLAHRGLALLERLPDPAERDRQELRLQMILIGPLQFLKGYAAEEVGVTFARSRTLCRQLGDSALLCPALWGLTAFYLMSGDVPTALQVTDEFIALAEAEQDPAYLILARQSRSTVLFYLADFQGALNCARQVIEEFDPKLTDRLIALCGRHPVVMSYGCAASSLWVLGYPEQALKTMRQGVVLAESSGHPMGIMLGHYFLAKIHRLRREPAETRNSSEGALALANEYGAATYMGAGRVLRGWAVAHLGQLEKGEAELRQGLDICHRSGGMVNSPQMRAMLAEVCTQRDGMDDATRAIADALDLVNRTNEHFYEGELHRLRGELLLRGSPDDLSVQAQAESAFRDSLQFAQRQDAKSLELRAGVSLARLYQRLDRPREARSLLSEIHDWFTEGFETPDLQEAQALLNELN